jgi:hypothetical protein
MEVLVLCVDLSSAVIFCCSSASCCRSRFLQFRQTPSPCPHKSSLGSQRRLGSRPQPCLPCVNVGIARVPPTPTPAPPPSPPLPSRPPGSCTGFGLAVTPFARELTMLLAIPKCYLFPFRDTTQRKETNPIALHVESCIWSARMIHLVPGLRLAWVSERVIVAGPDPPTALPVHVSVVGQLMPLLVRSPLRWRGNNA